MLEAPAEIIELVDKFERNLEAYKNPNYKEEQLKQEFINPFFKALGWDVDNTTGSAPQYRDVIFEDSIKVAGGTRAPDYCFTLAGRKIFFVEAKKPSVNIDKDIKPSYQLRRYAWSAKLPLSILTDFEELAVYESRTRPKKNDRASAGRITYLTYKDYVDQWDYLYNTFSKDAVLKGSYDKYAETTKKKKGTTLVDDEFLSEIETWRELLAKDIALRNSDLTVEELNYSVQQIIDRIIFLRMAEDRGAERYGQLQNLLDKQEIYQELCEIWKAADEKYNSGLFHFKNERTQKSPPDNLTPQLEIKDGIFKQIIKNLYYPDSPYEFSVLSPEILGNVYEQFLGKVIRLTKGHRAKVEEKPEVKKAGGVYYTPQYIVEYIIENTLGKLCKDKTPKKVSKLHILDPSCGSGSFLLGAYNYLLNWHLIYYTNLKDKNRLKDQIYKGKNSEWHLTIKEKKRILLNNIYGVDIDHQAVEVTKLSLLLKVLEGENRDVLEAQQKLYKERALPNLEDNIKCGNSLIGPEIYNDPKLDLTLEDIKKINPFEWVTEFRTIMKDGGFDAIIGNPPYVDIKGLPEIEVNHIFEHYQTSNNRINLFATFIERSLSIVKPNFRFSMIIPTAILTQSSYKGLRKMIMDDYSIGKIARLPNESFGAAAGDVKVDTVIIVIEEKLKSNMVNIIAYSGYDRINKIDPKTASINGVINQNLWYNKEDYVWTINISEAEENILIKCDENALKLEDVVEFSLGLTPYDKYKGQSKEQIVNKVFHSNFKENDTFKELLAGNDVKRYSISWNGEQWISYGPWLGAPRQEKFFTEKRILVKQIIDWSSKRIWASITDDELYNTQNAFNLLSKSNLKLEYILGILNSRLLTFYHRKRYLDEFKMRFQKILIKDCRRFPIHNIDFSNIDEKLLHDHIVKLVETILKLNINIDTARTPQDKELIQRQIDSTDKKIDKFVYELYGLNEDEIKIVEEE